MRNASTLERIRSRFPALARTEAGRPVAYFDGPGGTQVPREVGDAVANYLYHHNANTHWEYPTSAETDRILADARVVLADFLGGEPDEIVFGANMTTLTYHLSRTLGQRWGPGDEVVITELDHHANVAPWRALESERGVTIRTVPMDIRTGTLVPGALEDAIGARTRLVAVGCASNALGTITDLRDAVSRARAVRALVFVDAVHYAPHRLVDVVELGCDFLACSAYKLYGPHVGVMWGRRALLDELPVPKLDPAPDDAPESWEIGTQNHEGVAGAAAAVEFLAGLGEKTDASGAAARESVAVERGVGAARVQRRQRLADAFHRLEAHSDPLFARMWEGLGSIRGVRLFGPPPGEPRTPTLAFVVDGVAADDVARSLARAGVFISHGDFYAATVVERIDPGPGGLVRAGCACYTTEEEVDRLVAGVAEIAHAGTGASR